MRSTRHRGFASAALETGIDTTDGSLIFNTAAAEAGAVLPIPVSYAPIGPFGTWRLRVVPNDNPKLNLSPLKRIIIDFHGFCETFSH